MPSFYEDVEVVFPGLWAEFCSQVEGDVTQWVSKLSGTAPCLDRDWRKIVFKLFDYLLTTRTSVDCSYRSSGHRLDVIVHPFKIYYSQLLSEAETNASKKYYLSSSSSWPWSADAMCNAFISEEQLVAEVRLDLNRINIDLRKTRLKFWHGLQQCLERADQHDLGRNVFSMMNSCSRLAIVQHRELQTIMSMIQRIIDADVGHKDVLRKFLFSLVEERCLLPDYLKINGIIQSFKHGDNPISTRGGQADIFTGIYEGSEVALKRMRGVLTKDALLALYKEAIVWTQLDHDHILPFLGICDNLFGLSDSTVLVSPWVELGDLAEFSKASQQLEYDGTGFILQIASGLEYLHSQEPHVVHGDLRGSNVLISRGANCGYQLRLTDFGIANIEQIYTHSKTYICEGAPRWMAPEILDPQHGSSGHATIKSDVYAYSMTCIEVFTGNVPFAHLKRDVQVLKAILTDKCRPERPGDRSLAQRRGLTDHAWKLLEKCWNDDWRLRPHVTMVTTDLRSCASAELSLSSDSDNSSSDNDTTIELSASPFQTAVNYKPYKGQESHDGNIPLNFKANAHDRQLRHGSTRNYVGKSSEPSLDGAGYIATAQARTHEHVHSGSGSRSALRHGIEASTLEVAEEMARSSGFSNTSHKLYSDVRIKRYASSPNHSISTKNSSASMIRFASQHESPANLSDRAGISQTSKTSSSKTSRATLNRLHRESLSECLGLLDAKIRLLLSGLLDGEFESGAAQIISWANLGELDADGRTLCHITFLIFENAVDNAFWSETHARLCRRIMEQISPSVRDNGTLDQQGNPLSGKRLFIHYLHAFSSEHLDGLWRTRSEVESKATADRILRTHIRFREVDDHPEARQAKHRVLNFVRFTGKLFGVDLVPGRVVHGCIRKLFDYAQSSEEDVLCLCELLANVGRSLDRPDARGPMDSYFGKLKRLANNNNLSASTLGKVVIIIELRNRRWQRTS